VGSFIVLLNLTVIGNSSPPLQIWTGSSKR